MEEPYIIVTCPHCELLIQINISHINCGVFRHAAFKTNFELLNPHAPKELCDKLVADNLIYGCGKPFRLTYTNGLMEAIKCDYI